MAIYRHLKEASFCEADLTRLAEAYECALTKLRLADRHDPVTELIATKVIEIYRGGDHDPAHVCGQVLKDLGLPEAP